MQITSVVLVSAGVVLATLAKPKPGPISATTPEDTRKYLTGITMLVVSLFLTAFLGLLQEKTYKKYGPCWKEGVFYTVSYSASLVYDELSDLFSFSTSSRSLCSFSLSLISSRGSRA
ncbi:hypothetical protein H0H81_007827 [Sphagnurus paluster]|uniref:Uncharacterized protein n=1 Tax=Sphagnurus paluster TaxID=117069 RepID=A0A9P7K4F1_9AGAR|nr:hypothetical protein H0H81_007827 [Sphagnurus paluster]